MRIEVGEWALALSGSNGFGMTRATWHHVSRVHGSEKFPETHASCGRRLYNIERTIPPTRWVPAPPLGSDTTTCKTCAKKVSR